MVTSGQLERRPCVIVAVAYVSSEIPVSADEETLAESRILASSCFNREELS